MVVSASLDWLQTLADPTRVRLLRLLDQQELAVTELCTVLQLPQSTVSRHLKVLVDDQWIANRRDGTNQLYRIVRESWPEPRVTLWNWVRSQADSPTTSLDQQRLASVLAERSRSELFFSSAADQWDRMRVELFGKKIDAISLAASMPPNAIVGELGCGSAPLSQLVAPYVDRVYAVDNSAAMLAAAKVALSGVPNVRLCSAPLTELPMENDCLDLAWLTLVLIYLPDPVMVLREAARVLKSGAPLVILDMLPHDRSSYRVEMGHLRLGIPKDEMLNWLEQSGLTLRRYVELRPDAQAKGPALFSIVAYKQE